MNRDPRRPLRLLILGAVLLWVVSPLAIGGCLTVLVRAENRGHVGVGLGAALTVWALVCLVLLLAGFGALVGGVLTWWRSRHAEQVVETMQEPEPADDWL